MRMNLSLGIIGNRRDGFHILRTVPRGMVLSRYIHSIHSRDGTSVCPESYATTYLGLFYLALVKIGREHYLSHFYLIHGWVDLIRWEFSRECYGSRAR